MSGSKKTCDLCGLTLQSLGSHRGSLRCTAAAAAWAMEKQGLKHLTSYSMGRAIAGRPFLKLLFNVQCAESGYTAGSFHKRARRTSQYWVNNPELVKLCIATFGSAKSAEAALRRVLNRYMEDLQALHMMEQVK